MCLPCNQAIGGGIWRIADTYVILEDIDLVMAFACLILKPCPVVGTGLGGALDDENNPRHPLFQ